MNLYSYLLPPLKRGGYGGKTSEYELVRVKGLKNPIPFSQLLRLLIKDSSIQVSQEKWYKNMKEGHISIRKEIYNLMLTENKRQLIYDENNKFIGTKPYIINNKKEIK